MPQTCIGVEIYMIKCSIEVKDAMERNELSGSSYEVINNIAVQLLSPSFSFMLTSYSLRRSYLVLVIIAMLRSKIIETYQDRVFPGVSGWY